MVSTADSPKLHRFAKLLYFFAVAYPLILVPGALWHKPSIIGLQERAQALETFQLFPKIIFLLIVGVLGLLTVRKINWREPVTIMLGLYGALVLASIVWSGDFSTYSLLGPSERLDGLLYQTALVLFGLACWRLLRDNPQFIRPALLALLLGGAIQSGIILVQRLGLDFVGMLVRWSPMDQPAGTLTHAGMAAGYLLPLTFVGLWLYTQAKNPRQSWLPLVLSLLVAAGLGLTGNRAAFFAWLGVLLLFNLFYRNPRVLLASAVLMLGFWGARGVVPNYQGFSKAYTQTNTLDTRLGVWQVAFQLIPQIAGQPIVGGGPNAFKIAQVTHKPLEQLAAIYRIEYAEFWPPNTQIERLEMVDTAAPPLEQQFRIYFSGPGTQKTPKLEFGFSFDKAHNFVLDRLLPYGVVAALIWVALYLLPLRALLRTPRLAHSGLVWALLAMFIYYLVWFAVVQTEPLQVLLLVAVWAWIAQPAIGVGDA